MDRHTNQDASRSTRFTAVVSGVLALFLTAPASAIPSPDLVINLSASVAQLLGLVSVVFGGVAMRKKKGGAKRRRAGEGAPRAFFGIAILLLLGSLAANALQYTRALDARTDRLHTNLVRKSVENGKSVGDTSLKTLSFSDQLTHPQGVETETLADWLESDIPVNLIDVREDEEYESGAISGTSHLRYPDVLTQSSLLPDTGSADVRTVLLCYSGNRSSELCEALTAEGKQCNFMVGGYEKWLTEARPVSDGMTASEGNSELRKLAEYPNKSVLLDTPDVHELVQNESAQFIDVRYPEDFVADHLPGAHNITMRALTTDSLDEKIKALPDVPLIGACYDKRSCFYSTVIGLRLSRAGYDYRGRYSVPHEYYIPNGGGTRAHVAAWQANQEQLTFASFVVKPARQLVDFLARHIDTPLLMLLALVAVVRLPLSPLALKAERDTRVQRSLKHELETIRRENDSHPRAATQATIELLQRHRVRPVAGMLNSMLQLGLTLLFYSAISGAAQTWQGPFLWVATAATPDPTLLLPIATSLLFGLVIALQVRPETLRGRGLLVLGVVALFWLVQALGSAVNLYLSISMAVLSLQAIVFARIAQLRRWDSRGRTPAIVAAEAVEDSGLVPLALAHLFPETAGRKAARLGQLIEAGFDVPGGFVITDCLGKGLPTGTLDAVDDSDGRRALLDAHGKQRLDELWKELGSPRVAVRSSGANEDGSEASFAGVYESILNVERAGLEQAARSVYESLDSQRSAGYAQHGKEDDTPVASDIGGVLVQAMVPAEYAGVLFTEHPTTSGAMLVEVVAGLGEDLVSGTVTPDTFKFGKLSGALQSDGAAEAPVPPIDLAPLLALGRELEVLFGAPQDVEWAFAGGRFRLLQARDITRPVTAGDTLGARVERERARLLTELAGRRRQLRRRESDAVAAPLLVQNELSELLPRPTPVSADLMKRLWEANGSTDIACQELGMPYDVHQRSVPYVTTVFNWTYVNREEQTRRVGKGPGALASFRLSRDAEALADQFTEDFLPGFRADMIERNAIAMDRLSLDVAAGLLGVWVERFVTETYVQAERINIACGFHVETAREKLIAAKLDPATHLVAAGDSIAAGALAMLSRDTVDAEVIEEFLLVFGHRAPLDYELSTPRFNEDPELVARYIERSGQASTAHVADESLAAELAGKRVLSVSVERARRFQTLKEDAKHYCLIELAQIRQLLLAIDREAGLDGRVFQLTIDEVTSLEDAGALEKLSAVADQRAADRLAWASLQPPVSVSLDALERIDLISGEMPGSVDRGALAGARVAGTNDVTGTARVIASIDDIDSFVEGEILIARMTDPTWYPLFPKAAGIVTEIGGWLSHAAIVAREFDLPAIVGVENACRTIGTGDIVTLKRDGNVVLEQDRRDPAPAPVPDPIPGAEGNVHAIDDHRRFRFISADERRMLKANQGDRRRVPRYDIQGNLLPDRRAVARGANLSVYRRMA